MEYLLNNHFRSWGHIHQKAMKFLFQIEVQGVKNKRFLYDWMRSCVTFTGMQPTGSDVQKGQRNLREANCERTSHKMLQQQLRLTERIEHKKSWQKLVLSDNMDALLWRGSPVHAEIILCPTYGDLRRRVIFSTTSSNNIKICETGPNTG